MACTKPVFNRKSYKSPCLWLVALCCLFILAACPARVGFARTSAGVEAGRLLPETGGKHSIWQQGFFRVKFMREGEDAVPAADVNGNGVPDFVEDVAAQLLAAHYVFCVWGGFPSPLESPRYKGVRYVYAVIRGSSGMGGKNGLAYDEISFQQELNARSGSARGRGALKIPVLTIAVNKNIDPKTNPTPAHEYFHQIQNGMTHFKNPWFYEGMAVWAQAALKGVRPGKNGGTALAALRDPESRKAMEKSSYAAGKTLWGPLSGLCREASAPLPGGAALSGFAYTDGSRIITAGELTGGRLMLRALEKFGKYESVPYNRFDYGSWTEANQRRTENNDFIVKGVLGAAEEICPRQ